MPLSGKNGTQKGDATAPRSSDSADCRKCDSRPPHPAKGGASGSARYRARLAGIHFRNHADFDAGSFGEFVSMTMTNVWQTTYNPIYP